MNEPQAYLNGRYVPATQAVVAVSDYGFVMGATVAEQLRTFGGRLFRLEDHLARLERSLGVVGVDPGVSVAEIGRVAQELATHNHRFLDPADDLNLTLFVTPGAYPTMAASGGASGPTVGMHTFALPFALWAEKYTRGEWLVTPGVEQVSAQSWPRDLKCRSRMHYYLAERQATALDPGARALMLDERGFITETTTANVLAYVPGEGLIGPPRSKVLPGISLAVLIELASRAGISYSERDLRPSDISSAQEVLLTGTSICILPVTRFNREPVGRGKPGQVYELLLAAWSRLTGIDIAAQSTRFATR